MMTRNAAETATQAVMKVLKERGIEQPSPEKPLSEETSRLIADTILESYREQGIHLPDELAKEVVVTLLQQLGKVGTPGMFQATVPGMLSCLSDALGELDTVRRGLMGLVRELNAKDDRQRIVSVMRAAGLLQGAETLLQLGHDALQHAMQCECMEPEPSERPTEPAPAEAS